nr:retrovirus-related Pol polyprotein from transposon TNT 1-94 [Tanacetum cinerariifolium]
MTENLKLLINFIWTFLGTVRFRNDHVAVILGYGDLQWGNILIARVYFVEGLGHNLLSVGQFCDLGLEVAFRRNTCFVRNLEGVALLKGNHTINLYIINIHEMTSASPIYLMARATSTKSWLWHQRLSHLNFDTINDLAKNDLVTGLLKFKYHKEHLCPSCKQEKRKKPSHPPKPILNLKQRLRLLHMDLCGRMIVKSINGKRYILVIVDDYSCYTLVHFLRSKDEAPEVINTFLKKIQVLLQASVIIVLVLAPDNIKPLTLKWLFKNKLDEENTVISNKTRLVVRGYRKEEGIDFEYSFILFARMESSKLGSKLTSLAVSELGSELTSLARSELGLASYRGKENGIYILQLIDHGPFELGTTRDTLGTIPEGCVLLRPERPRMYHDLNDNKKKRFNADVCATNIVLQGLPKYIYKLINHNNEAKAIWDNVKILLARSELTKEDRESQLYDEFECFKMLLGENINEYYVRFHKLVNDMRNIRMTMPNIRLNSKFVNNMSPE